MLCKHDTLVKNYLPPPKAENTCYRPPGEDWGVKCEFCSLFFDPLFGVLPQPDQTPTPTRFLKNCEEVGLFNELAGSFEHDFKRAAEDDDKKARTGGHGAGK